MTSQPLDDLRAQLAGLERDGRTIAIDVERATDEAAKWEQRAMDAVERGDDAAAREALEQQDKHAERAALAERELALIRQTQDKCRALLAAAGADVDAPASDEEDSNEED